MSSLNATQKSWTSLSNSKSRLCINRKPTLNELLNATFGDSKSERFTTKAYLQSVFRDEFTTKFITELCDFLRSVLYHVQIFVNTYLFENYEPGDLKTTIQQNCWYSIRQLVMGVKLSNKNYVSNAIVLAIDDFKASHPSIVCQPQGTPIKGYSSCL